MDENVADSLGLVPGHAYAVLSVAEAYAIEFGHLEWLKIQLQQLFATTIGLRT